MSFTYAQAITRLTSGPTNVFKIGLTSGQQLQRLNEVIEGFWEEGTWRGLHVPVTLTSTSSIISLAETYLRLDGLGVPNLNQVVPIKSQTFQFSPNGPQPQDWSAYGGLIALDLGDSAGGQRQYQLTGGSTNNDALSFTGLARKRYAWVSDTSTVVVPDSYKALELGVRAKGWLDEGDETRYQTDWALALKTLNSNLDEFAVDERQVQIQITNAFGSMPMVH